MQFGSVRVDLPRSPLGCEQDWRASPLMGDQALGFRQSWPSSRSLELEEAGSSVHRMSAEKNLGPLHVGRAAGLVAACRSSISANSHISPLVVSVAVGLICV